MKSFEVKNKLIHYFRIKRRYFFIATEVGKYNADVLVANSKEIIECEVKVSLADLKKDLKKKKHTIYANSRTHYCPNKFYFAVPTELVDAALLLTENSPYGVISVLEGKLLKKSKKCKIIKRAKLLKSRYCSKLESQIIKRMGSELLSLRIRS